ncbi:hypothetical protein C1H71_02970 [Iodobacter fluviatilis]|uniref:Uncharacterized protein n=1 Tax=Iodobacter fluviatilis TaxID=537 RepID=A0A7G3G671_9NEIS|nr:hypothetical protein C1H71_02970 [Iodobacter fluviatilis]
MTLKAHILLFISSIIFYTSVELIDVDIPISTGIYRGERYRLSAIEPDAEVKTQVTINRSGEIQQTLVLNDLSLKSNAAFSFTGRLFNCSLYYCTFESTSHALEKPKINQTLYKSRYLDLLKMDNKIKSSPIHFIYKDKSILFLSIEDKYEQRYNLYTLESRASPD